jgi:acyl dehydratase
VVTHHVKANLFYRGLMFHRFPVIGDTLVTRTEVVGLRQNSPKPGRAPTGMAALRMTTIDQIGELVLDFYRCAMLPLSPGANVAGGGPWDDLSAIGRGSASPTTTVAHWDGEVFRARVPGPHFDPSITGTVLHSSADVVTSAAELARLTLNVAAVHHDSRVGGRRLVYGGHTIGLALAQASRMLPNLATVLAWESCEHTGPVYEGDTLVSELRVQAAKPLPHGGGGVLRLRSLASALGGRGAADRPVLDWRFSALQF